MNVTRTISPRGTGQRSWRIQQAEKSHAAKGRAEQRVRPATAKARMRVIGDPAHQDRSARGANVRTLLPSRGIRAVLARRRHVDEDPNDQSGAGETGGPP